jgi:molybdate transport system substrate-binding protein
MLSRRRCIHGLILSLAALASSTASSTWAAETTRPELPRSELLIFAAASLTDAMEEIGAAYTRQSGQRVKFSFAASSALARQIEAGGRIDVFLSADLEWMDYLQARNLIAPDSRKNVVGNRLVLIAPKDSTVRIELRPKETLIYPSSRDMDSDLRRNDGEVANRSLPNTSLGLSLRSALGVGRLATGDPDIVPVGRYAQAALTSLGAWSDIADRLVRADNVRAALVFVARGEAPLGIVYETDATADARVRIVDIFPADSHPPITYPVAVTTKARPGAREFVDFLFGPTAQASFRKLGFQPPPPR